MSIFTKKAYNKMQSVLSEMEKDGRLQKPDATSPIVPDEKANLTFAVFGDPQCSNYMHNRQRCFLSACLDLKNMEKELDALILAGDIAENGMQCEYDLAEDILKKTTGKVRNILLLPGNHDTRLHPFHKQLRKFQRFMKKVPNCAEPEPGHYYYEKEIGGYTFLSLGPDAASFEGSFLSARQLRWLDEKLDGLKDCGKPVFVLNHQTLKKHNGLPGTWIGFGKWRGSVGWQSDKLKAIFEKYDNVFFITGHLHFCTGTHSFEDHGRYKVLAAQTVGAGNHGDYGEESQGYVVSVYDDKILLRARLFGKGQYVPEEIPNAKVEIRL